MLKYLGYSYGSVGLTKIECIKTRLKEETLELLRKTQGLLYFLQIFFAVIHALWLFIFTGQNTKSHFLTIFLILSSFPFPL